MTNWNDKTISASDWRFTCDVIEKERIEQDAYISVEWDHEHCIGYSITVLLTYSKKNNDYEYLFYANTDEYPNLDIFHIYNQCVEGAKEIAEDYNIKLVLPAEPIHHINS